MFHIKTIISQTIQRIQLNDKFAIKYFKIIQNEVKSHLHYSISFDNFRQLGLKHSIQVFHKKLKLFTQQIKQTFKINRTISQQTRIIVFKYQTKREIKLTSKIIKQEEQKQRMGSLQSFTPLAQSRIILFLYNPSQQLQQTMKSPQFKQFYKFTVKITDVFPLSQILQNKTQHSDKSIKVIVQEQNLIDICHFALTFHHKIVIVTKQGPEGKNPDTHNKQLAFEDNIEGNDKQLTSIDCITGKDKVKSYSPIQIQCFKYCPSLSLEQIVKFIQQKNRVKNEQVTQSKKNQPYVTKQRNLQKLQQNQQTLNLQSKKQIANTTRMNNYRRRTTHLSIRLRQDSQNLLFKNANIPLENLQHQKSSKRLKIPQLLFQSHPCPFSPISIVLTHLPTKMIKKILNLLQFYQANFVKYSSLEVFFVAQCNSTKIVCGSAELQQLGRKVQAQQYPFKVFSNKNVALQSSPTIDEGSMHVLHQSQNILHGHQSQDITFFCFCNQTFSHHFSASYSKLVGVLKDRLIQIRFFKNMLELVRQLIKEQNIQAQKDVMDQMMKQRADHLSTLVLQGVKVKKSSGNINLEGSDARNQQPMNLPAQSVNEPCNTKSANTVIKQDSLSTIDKNRKFNSISKKDTSKATPNNMNETVPRLSIVSPQIGTLSQTKNPSLLTPKSLQDRHLLSIFNPTIYFLMHQKQKDRYSIQSLPKKLTRYLKNMKVKKVLSLDSLVDKIKNSTISMVVINDNAKIVQQFYMTIEMNGIQDKIIVIKRQQGQTYQTLLKKINQARELGVVKLERFYHFRYLNRKMVIMGSKQFLRHILSKYPYIEVKQFIDVTIYKQHMRIRQVISRKNQIIISNVPVCELCNQDYKGLVKAKIIYYESNIENNHAFIMSGRGECKCPKKNIFLDNNSSKPLLPLNKLLDQHPFYITAYPYCNKKLSHWSNQFSTLLAKIKEKKYLTNIENNFQRPSKIAFLCADSWIIDQVTMIVIKVLSTRYTSIWLTGWMAKKIIYNCVQQVQAAIKFQVQSSLVIYKGQLTRKANQIIHESKQVYRILEKSLQQLDNVFQLSQVLLELFIQNTLFRKCINYMWRSLLSLNKHQYPLNCSTLFLVILLGFRKSAAMARIDSINDGTFKSFRKIDKEDTVKSVNIISSFQQIAKSKNLHNKSNNNCSFEDNNSCVGSSTSQLNTNLKPNIQQNAHNHHQKTMDFLIHDGIQEQDDSQIQKSSSLKVYLKLAHYQKPEEDESLRNFFISKNNVFSYIYTTQFLMFQMIDEQEIQEIVMTNMIEKQKLNNNNAIMNNIFNSSSPAKFGNGRHRKSDSLSSSNGGSLIGNNPNYMTGFHMQMNKKYPQMKSSQFNQTSSPLSALISPLLTPNHSSNKLNSKKVQPESPLQLKSCKNIELLSSTQNCLIICVQNIQLLNYNLFIPFYRSNSGKKAVSGQSVYKKKYFIIAPFTKLQINNNHYNLSPKNNRGTYLMTHQLKLSTDHQQRFLQKILDNFLVDKSQYYDFLDSQQRQEKQKSFQMDSSALFDLSGKQLLEGSLDADGNKKYQQLFVLKQQVKRQNIKNSNPWDLVKLVDERFKLPHTDQFFILMNQFKYFSAHHLLFLYFPRTNIADAYHAILLSRKGLYHEALSILLPNNPFKFTIQSYIQELRNRIIENGYLNQDQFSSNPTERPRKIKWRLSYSGNEEKFYLKSKMELDKSYCYNDDSLDIIYKQVLAQIQNNTKNKYQINVNRQNNIHADNQIILGTQLLTGTFVDSRNIVRRQEKDSSIDFSGNQFSLSLQNDRTNKLSEPRNTSTIHRRSGVNMSLKSRDSLLKDLNLFQQSQLEKLAKNYSECHNYLTPTYRSPSFIFGNQENKQQESLNLALMQQRPQHQQKQPLKNEPQKLCGEQQNSEKLSSSPQNHSQQSERDQILARRSLRKVTPINVKTRNKSNFFMDRVQLLKKQAEIIRLSKQKYNSQKMLIKSPQFKCINFSATSKQEEEQISQTQQIQRVQEVQKTKSQVQRIMNDDVREGDSYQDMAKTIQTIKKLPLLFRNFRKQSSNDQPQNNKINESQNLRRIIKQQTKSLIENNQIFQVQSDKQIFQKDMHVYESQIQSRTYLTTQINNKDFQIQSKVYIQMEAGKQSVKYISKGQVVDVLQDNRNVLQAQINSHSRQNKQFCKKQIHQFDDQIVFPQQNSSNSASQKVFLTSNNFSNFSFNRLLEDRRQTKDIKDRVVTQEKAQKADKTVQPANQDECNDDFSSNKLKMTQNKNALNNQKHKIKPVNKIACKFTLDLSSQQSQQQSQACQHNQVIQIQNKQHQCRSELNNEIQDLGNINQSQNIQESEFQKSYQYQNLIGQQEYNQNCQDSLDPTQFTKKKLNKLLQFRRKIFIQNQTQQKPTKFFGSPYKEFQQYLQRDDENESQEQEQNKVFTGIEQQGSEQNKVTPGIKCQLQKIKKFRQAGVQTQEIGTRQKRRQLQQKPQKDSKSKITVNFSFKKKKVEPVLYQLQNKQSSSSSHQPPQKYASQSSESQEKAPRITKPMVIKPHLRKVRKFRDSIQSSISSQNLNQSKVQNARNSQDNEQFLLSHTTLLNWHNKRASKLPNSSKLINSSKMIKLNSTHNLNAQKVILDPNYLNKDSNLGQRHKIPVISVPKKEQRQSIRSNQNVFTFMKPSTGSQNKPIYRRKEVDAQSEHIQDFHNKLMNNSSIFMNESSAYPDRARDKPDNQAKFYTEEDDSCSTVRFVIHETNRHEGLKPIYPVIGGPQEKFNINVKNMRAVDQVQYYRMKETQTNIRRSALDYNHQKEQYLVSHKINRSSKGPLSARIKTSQQKRQSLDSWFDQPAGNNSLSISYLDSNKIHNSSLRSDSRKQLMMIGKSKIRKKPTLEQQNIRREDQKSQQLVKNDKKNKTNYQGHDKQQHCKYKGNLTKPVRGIIGQHQGQHTLLNQLPNTGKRKKDLDLQCKIYPEELLNISPYNNKKSLMKKQYLINQEKQKNQFSDLSSQLDVALKVDVMSLENLRLNCDIRRKR